MSCGKKEAFEGYVFSHYCGDGTEVQLKIASRGLSHPELGEIFTRFLRACGFIFDSYAEYKLVSEREENE